MTWSIGSFVFDVADEPDAGAVSAIAQHNWIKVNGIGYRGSIKQYTHTDSREHRLHAYLPLAAKDELQAIYDAQALNGGSVDFVCPEPPFSAGVPVVIMAFRAEWNESVRGIPWYDCWITMDEDAA